MRMEEVRMYGEVIGRLEQKSGWWFVPVDAPELSPGVYRGSTWGLTRHAACRRAAAEARCRRAAGQGIGCGGYLGFSLALEVRCSFPSPLCSKCKVKLSHSDMNIRGGLRYVRLPLVER